MMERNNMDPFGSMNNFRMQQQQFRQNPLGFMAQRGLNIPQQYQNDPSGAIQYLMNSGKLTQQQYNYAMNMGKQLGLIR